MGNPGGEYEDTRHNVGYEVLDELASRFGVRYSGGGRTYVSGEGNIAGDPIQLVKPIRYMNRSGIAWRELALSDALDPELVLVIYDDIHLPLGKLRVRLKGGAGGHNGLTSILEAAGHQNVPRIRLGIGGEDRDWVDHVLSPFTSGERQIADRLVALAADAVEVAVKEGVETAMNRFSGSSAQEIE